MHIKILVRTNILAEREVKEDQSLGQNTDIYNQ